MSRSVTNVLRAAQFFTSGLAACDSESSYRQVDRQQAAMKLVAKKSANAVDIYQEQHGDDDIK
ncbi:hypothetical protein M378DRAFT_165013 [Amanita muscaria Koide BX008]|uniref:Uncharacterized protein n=1 Tax=Amanita muscaria (strain Koide BX008) TaxID=946122 RepID=A0A0C2X2M0_AMAMK|nr:hypothetical protein M378DRAFT_165013 [Amanita muscaria Koide BX008]